MANPTPQEVRESAQKVQLEHTCVTTIGRDGLWCSARARHEGGWYVEWPCETLIQARNALAMAEAVERLREALALMYFEWMDQGHGGSSPDLLCLHSQRAETLAYHALFPFAPAPSAPTREEKREEGWYNRNAVPACLACKGLGMLTYYFDQDEARSAPCPTCFPLDRWAQDTRKRWDAHCR